MLWGKKDRKIFAHNAWIIYFSSFYSYPWQQKSDPWQEHFGIPRCSIDKWGGEQGKRRGRTGGLAKTGTVTKKAENYRKMSRLCRVFAVILCHFQVKKKKKKRDMSQSDHDGCYSSSSNWTQFARSRSLPVQMKQNHACIATMGSCRCDVTMEVLTILKNHCT